jgi:hypothetical protein
MKRKVFFLFFLLGIPTFWFAVLDVKTTSAQISVPWGTPTPVFTPTPIPDNGKLLIESQRNFNNASSLIAPLSLPVRGTTGDWWADVVIGQPNFAQLQTSSSIREASM